jgi:tRNA pseudouridine55 synthase
MEQSSEIVLIDKPAGMTSFGVVARVRRILGVKKAGHAGTLDPLATGLMVVGVGKGTKLLTNLVKLDKEYVTEILIGQRRSTGDMEGVVLEERAVATTFSDEEITTTLQSLLGDITLPVSAYSAIKIDGVPMYKRARAAEQKGEVADPVPARAMRVDEVELLESKPFEFEDKHFQLVTVRFAVGSGTYIRSLGEEFGRRLGYPATLYSLRRTRVGEFRITDAVTLEQLAAAHGATLY